MKIAWYGSGLFFVVGIVLFGFGIFRWYSDVEFIAIAAMAIRKRRLTAWLACHGVNVKAAIQGIERDMSVSVHGRHPWRLAAHWLNPATRGVHVFYSDSVWFDPKPSVQNGLVDVLINPDNPNQYAVDISFLSRSA